MFISLPHICIRHWRQTGLKGSNVGQFGKISIYLRKKLILIPIVNTLHWSLCVIINPGAVEKSDLISSKKDKEDTPLSCMLFFNYLKMHNKVRSQQLLIKWLNSEWQRVNDTFSAPFTRKNYRIYDPEGVFELLRIVLGFYSSLSPYVNFSIDAVHFPMNHSPKAKKWL
jgi:hypothetical protein